MFLNKSLTETDYQFNGTLELRGQTQETCINLKVKLKVKRSHLHKIRKNILLLSSVSLAVSAQDNIKDKMRSIPVEVSTDILSIRTKRTKNSLPQLIPMLDSSAPSKDATEVKKSDYNTHTYKL